SLQSFALPHTEQPIIQRAATIIVQRNGLAANFLPIPETAQIYTEEAWRYRERGAEALGRQDYLGALACGSVASTNGRSTRSISSSQDRAGSVPLTLLAWTHPAGACGTRRSHGKSEQRQPFFERRTDMSSSALREFSEFLKTHGTWHANGAVTSAP